MFEQRAVNATALERVFLNAFLKTVETQGEGVTSPKQNSA